MRIVCFVVAIFLFACCTSCSSNNASKPEKRRINVSQSWVGKWERKTFQSSGVLEIFRVNGDSIQFALHVSSGAHESSIEGLAMAIDTNVVRHSSMNGSDSCVIEFMLIRDTIVIRQWRNKCSTAIGVVYDGTYTNKDEVEVENEQNKTLVDLEIFRTKEQDSIFRALTGNKYSLFLESTQLTSQDEDLDSLNTIVKSSAVRGLFTLMENIIMIDPENTIWAAVIDDKQRVLYFTNSKLYRNALPKTIDNWRQNFKEYPVIFGQ